ncbi:MAG: GNAT family N-acetyltransferase [Bacteroidetes bacterium]|nr:GNAT family N-acetyltransferase [Bacteroidota bacterium]MBU1717916.1 GNAT family N-acetyltransferase [Bacteroidota bacterium]
MRRVSCEEDLRLAVDIRTRVFVEEQGVDPALEIDGKDSECTHYLAEFEGKIIGTARWRQTDKGIKLERFAVLKAFRNKRAGVALLQKVLADLSKADQKIYLHAQDQVVGFYEKFNFIAEGNEFFEAGIRHFKMIYMR